MRLPLVVLAVCAAVAGALGPSLDRFVGPVFASTHLATPSGSTSAVLIAIDGVVAVAGLAIAWWLWRGRAERPALTPQFLARVWYWDDAYDAVLGRPAQAVARASADVVDPLMIDGAVVGVATATRRAARQLRGLQNGYVRSYALLFAIGTALLLGYLLARTF
jgi:NADH-quinone oxidoreductase subunit L